MSSLLAALLLACPQGEPSAPAAGAEVLVDARIEPEDLVVGQEVRLLVDVVTETWFTRAPRLASPQVGDAIVLPLGRGTQNVSRTVDGRRYTGIRFKFVVYPRRAGRFEVPASTVRAVHQAVPGAAPIEFERQTEPLRFAVGAPPGVDSVDGLISSPRVTVRQVLSRPLDGLKVGDSFERTIEFVAEHSVGMLLPPFEPESSAGLGVYADRPSVAAVPGAGGHTGKRTESITYVLERAGDYALRDVRVRWWNTRTKQLEVATVDAVPFSVAPNPDVPAESVDAASERDDREAAAEPASIVLRLGLLLFGLAAVAFVVWLARRTLPRGREWLERRRARLAASEPVAWQRVRAACAANDDRETVRRLTSWLDRFGPDRPLGRLDSVVRDSGDPEVARQVASLVARIYGASSTGAWSGAAFLRALEPWRERTVREHVGSSREPVLVLNPVARCVDRAANS